ncbi:MAG: GMC family oxidoreductase [Nodosilinea sp.]
MIIDSREMTQDSIIETSICIIGSGPAGVTLAKEFANLSNHVSLLESGGISQEVDIQDLSDGEIIGDNFLCIKGTRNRQFGGNSNIWSIKLRRDKDSAWEMGVRYAPLDGIDFERRDWVPNSGWPISRKDLNPYYKKAQEATHSGPFAYDVESWTSEQVKPFDFGSSPLTSKVYQFGPRKVFHQDSLEKLSAAPNIDIYTYATVTDLDTAGEGSSIKQVRVSNSTGKDFWIRAKIFVLATGGIETARLMLASNRHQEAGVGNEHDVVGRFFMDHPLVDMGRLFPASHHVFSQAAFYDKREIDGHSVMGHIALTKEVMAEQQLLNSAVVLFPRPSHRQTRALLSLKTIVEDKALNLSSPSSWPKSAQHLLNVAGGLDYLTRAACVAKKYDQSFLPGFGRGGWAENPHIQNRFKMFEVLLVTEQAPDPSNQVKLSRNLDALGMPRVELNWKWGQFNIDIAKRTQSLFAEGVEKAGLGHFVSNFGDGEPSLPGPAGLAHHLGTTRMSASPQQGVVNENCRVHTVPNLYVASSSVFPTGGYTNPTLTILALALRLADHLKNKLP